MAKFKVYSDKHKAEADSCCPEALSQKGDLYYVQVDLEDCIKDCEEQKEFKTDEIKVTKEYKVKKKTK